MISCHSQIRLIIIIENWDWGVRLGIEIGDWGLEIRDGRLGIGIGIGDGGLG